MWIFRGLLIIVCFAAFGLFALKNTAQQVVVNVPWGPIYEGIPLMFVVLVSFVVGMFVWFMFSMLHDLKLRSDLRRARKESDRLREELKTIRNLPVQDMASAGDVLESEESPS